MRRILFIVALIGVTGVSYSQALRDINFSYQYEPGDFSFLIKAVRQDEGWTVFYKLEVLDTVNYSREQFSIEWEKRENVNESQGVRISDASPLDTSKYVVTGNMRVGTSPALQYLVARVTNKVLNKSGIFFKILEPDYPVNAYLENEDGSVVFESYVNTRVPVKIAGFESESLLTVSYYGNTFPQAVPPFSEGQPPVSRNMQPDSTFTIKASKPLVLERVGLYLVQSDPRSPTAMSFRVEESYPKFTRLQDLGAPFVYICTREEFQKIKEAGTDKKKFDKVILDLAKDSDRARILIRNYFKRIEIANQFFTSYKEGWKTDRGIIYIIYGRPKKVTRLPDREIWIYQNTNFVFMKSGSLFDPDNFTLNRNKRYAVQWYDKVELIRNSRF